MFRRCHLAISTGAVTFAPAPLRPVSLARVCTRAQSAPRLLPQEPSTPGYFDALTNSINIMQDHITRTRLADEPPHVLLAPRLRDIGLMEFNRAKAAMPKAAAALKMLRRYL